MSGLEGPDHTYDNPSGVLAALRRVAEEAQDDRDLGRLIPDEGLVESFAQTIHRLDREPATAQITDDDGTREIEITGDDLRGMAYGYTRRASTRGAIRSWPSDILRLIWGDWSGIADRVARNRRSYGVLSTASYFMLDCGSGISPERAARYASAKAT